MYLYEHNALVRMEIHYTNIKMEIHLESITGKDYMNLYNFIQNKMNLNSMMWFCREIVSHILFFEMNL